MTYVQGAVTRIKLQNFVTYDAVEFCPGPHLNVIVGPNGTGKSSIVCAICLGLAGKTNYLGRAQHPHEYIKHGCEKAIVELELHNNDGDNYVIVREIHRNRTSYFQINGRQVPQKAVEELVSKLGVQLGNLCQFLPQDKVADFAKMNQQELLENTEKAVGTEDMYAFHMKLKQAGEQGRNLQLGYQRLEEKLEQEKNLNARLEQDVENFKARQSHLEKIEMLRMKRAFVQYIDKRDQFTTAKENRNALQEKVQSDQKQLQPLKKEMEKQNKLKSSLEQQMKQKQEEIKKAASQASQKSKNIENESDQLSDVTDDLKQKKQDEERRKKRVYDLHQQVRTIQDELQNLEEEQHNLQPALDKIGEDMRDMNKQLNAAQRAGQQQQSEHTALQTDVRALDGELRALRDVNNQRLQLLQKNNKDAYAALQWLQANQHRLRAQIHGPLMLVINMRDTSWAKYLESHVALRDMHAFVCEDPIDMELFLKMMRDEQELRVNAIIMPNQPAPPQNDITPLKRYGFTMFMRDMFTCPDAVMRYLCRVYNVHNIPVGGKNMNAEKIINDLPDLRTFYTDSCQYSSKRSKYANVRSTRSTDLKQPKLLTVAQNTEREREVQAQLENTELRKKKKVPTATLR